VPTISFRLLYGLLILRHPRREVLRFAVTAHPNAEWIARQLTEACSWNEAPRYLVRDRDRDGACGEAFIRRIWAMGIRDRPISALSAAKLRNGSLVRSDESALIMSSSSASNIFVICSAPTKGTTTRLALICS
jgi:hypothetical protein